MRGFSKILRSFFFFIILLVSSCLNSTQVSAEEEDYQYLGFSGYITSIEELQKTIDLMNAQHLNVYRVSSKPSYVVPEGQFQGYNTDYIDYLLANSSFLIIVDCNHLYPPGRSGSQNASDHWGEIEARIFQVLSGYANNSRVAVELINEYTLDDYQTKMQALIDDIRSGGYTNTIVTNKWETTWIKLVDPLDNTYQGMHFYFNTWSPEDAIDSMERALGAGIKIINTEVGADYREYGNFTQETVDELELFLNQSRALGVNNCVWLNNDTQNWPTYVTYDLTLNPPYTPPTPTAYLAVRGADNAIYYRAYDSEGNWLGWNTLPGSTVDTPAATICNGSLYFAVRGDDGFSLWFGTVNLTDNSFSGWTPLEGATESAPTLTSNGSHVFLLVRGLNNIPYYRVYDVELASWGDWNALPGETCDQVAATVADNRLYVAVRGCGLAEVGNQTLWHCYVDLASGAFSGWSNLPGSTDAAPTLAASISGNVTLGVKGLDGAIYLNELAGDVWQGWSALDAGSTVDTPALAFAGGVLQVAVLGGDGASVWHCNVDELHVQSAWVCLDGATPSAPVLAS